jgi:N-acetylglucosamine kinase-like BadF-type ATPase
MHLVSVYCGEQRTISTLAHGRGKPLAYREASPLVETDLEAVLRSALAVAADLDGRPAVAMLALAQDSDAVVRRARSLAIKMLPATVSVWTCSALDAIAAGALGGRPGLVVHAGMRSGAVALDPQGQLLSVGNSGELLGDEGSALWLASRVVRLTVQGLMGRAPRSERLEQNLIAYFGRDSIEEVVGGLESGDIGKQELAGFVSVVLHLAEYPEPDLGCRSLVLQASRFLAASVKQVREQASFRGTPTATWSGEAMYGAMLECFEKDARRYMPDQPWSEPRYPPHAGCLLLARAAGRQAEPTGARREATQPGTGSRPRHVGPEVWRQLFRLRRPLDEWGEQA